MIIDVIFMKLFIKMRSIFFINIRNSVICFLCGLIIIVVGCSNEDNPYRVIDGKLFNTYEEVVFGPYYSLYPIFRIPSAVITNEGTILVATENRQEIDDKGVIDLLISRKDENTSTWNIVNMIPYNEATYGRTDSPSFVIDRLGAHGHKGRIYMFATQTTNYDYFLKSSAEEDDFIFIYSDDDGKTWSPAISLKEYWNDSDYTAIATSVCNGIQLSDGTFLIPIIVLKNGNFRSGILTKKPGKDWSFSVYTNIDGDNECSIYLDNDERIILDCRTIEKIHRKYRYDMANNSLELMPYNVSVPIDLKAEITEIQTDSVKYYLTTYVDTSRGVRENLTLYGSFDAINWVKLYTIKEGEGVAYGNVAFFNGKIVVAYEDLASQKIKIQDISSMSDKIANILEGKKNVSDN